MKTWKHLTFVAIIVFAFAFIACDDGTKETEHIHQWGAWVETTAPTCTTTGLETRTCTIDPTHKETQTKAIDPNAHDWEWVITVDPTIFSIGEETYMCTLCSISQNTRIAEKLNSISNTKEWNDAVEFIKNGGNDQTYTITVNGNIGLEGYIYGTNTFGSVTNLSITIVGTGKLYLTGQGNMLGIGGSQTLIIDSDDLTFEGLTNGINDVTQNNNASIIRVGSSGQLELRNGIIANNNSGSSAAGGGVFISYASSNTGFTKTGGIIYGNDASNAVDNNNAPQNMGHAVGYRAVDGALYYHDATLEEGDNLSTNDPLPTNSGETLGGWTKA